MGTVFKLLLIAYDKSGTKLTRKVLRRSGMQFKATIASDKPEFVAAIHHEVFDVILLDRSLSQFDSADVLKLLRDWHIYTPLILVGGTGIDDCILTSHLARLPSAITLAIEKGKIQKEKRDATASDCSYDSQFNLPPCVY